MIETGFLKELHDASAPSQVRRRSGMDDAQPVGV